jgi:hypothetical protein
LLNKPYGRLFLDSLPPMARTRDPQLVTTFFASQTDVAASQSTVA